MIITVDFDEYKEAYQGLTKTIYGSKKRIGELNTGQLKEYILVKDSIDLLVACCVYYPKTEMKFKNRSVVCFGYFESLEHVESVKEIVDYIESRLDREHQVLVAPINGDTWNEYRISINNDAVMFPMDIASPLYYSTLFKDAGLEVARNYNSHVVTKFSFNENIISNKIEKLKKLGIDIRNINLDQFDLELDKIYSLCMKSFKGSFLFTPIEKEEFKKKYLALKDFLQAEYIWMAIDQEGQLVGLMFALSFPGPEGTKGYMAKTLARLPEPKYAGLGSVLSGLLQDKAIKDECSFGIHAFMEEKNVSNIISNNFSGNEGKAYALYKSSSI